MIDKSLNALVKRTRERIITSDLPSIARHIRDATNDLRGGLPNCARAIHNMNHLAEAVEVAAKGLAPQALETPDREIGAAEERAAVVAHVRRTADHWQPLPGFADVLRKLADEIEAGAPHEAGKAGR